MRKHSIKVELCTPAIGAELSNISLADAAQDPDTIAEIRALWLKHKVLFFRDQDISPMEQQNFALQFAELESHPLAPSHPEADKLLMLYRNLDPSKPKGFVEKASRENTWHADVTFKKAPPRGAVLRCELGPETGGDTIWSNMVMAYEKDADRRTPRDGREKPRRRTPGGTHPSRDGRKGVVRQLDVHDPFLEFLQLRGRPVRPGLHAGGPSSDELSDLSGSDSGIPGTSEVATQHGCHVGQPAGSALRSG
ncbi:taurine dioxygenase [Cupriavidus basilensis OR16]|uniref:Taurine dioxygenase n=1 Tax=Cupriavidus basilensis OR16 TaxID=1127483 RepID=H1S818_9BURK|nr:taurine dioxygenase [Cupriavidus basilensis OR16]